MRKSEGLLPRFRSELIAQVSSTVITAAFVLLLARLLNPEEYGLLFLTISILSLLTVLGEAGVAKSGARYLAEYKERDPDLVPLILRTSLVYNLITILVVVVGITVGHRHLARLFDQPELVPLLLLGGLFVVFGTLTMYIRLTLQGLESIRLSAGIHLLTVLGRFVVAVGLVVLGYGVLGALGGYIVSYFLVTSLGFLVLFSRFRTVSEPPDGKKADIRSRVARYAVPLTATNTAKALELHVDTILVGFFLNPISVGFYVLGKQISQFIETPVYALGFALAPSYGSEKAQGNIDRASEMYRSSLEYALLLYTPAAAGLIIVARPTILYVFGPGYLGAVPVLQLLSLYVLFRAVAIVSEKGLDFLGRARSLAYAKFPSLLLNVLLSVLLIPTIGVTGAAIATVISHGVFSLSTVYIAHTELTVEVRHLARKMLVIVLITAVMSAGVTVGLRFVAGPLSLLGLVLFGATLWATLALTSGLLNGSYVRETLR